MNTEYLRLSHIYIDRIGYPNTEIWKVCVTHLYIYAIVITGRIEGFGTLI
jgi:hypothetical protein